MPVTGSESQPVPTVLSSWTRVLVQALRDHGIDPGPMILAAGLDPARISVPGARFPLTSTTRLWQLAARETGDESLGLWVSKYSNHTTFHALGYAFMASRTLLEALRRVVRFNCMVSDATDLALDIDEGIYSLRWSFRTGVRQRPANEAMEATIASMLRACRKLRGAGFSPLRAELLRPTPARAQPFRDFFRCDVAFGAPAYRLEFRRTDLEAALPDANEELADSNDRVVEDYLSRMALGGVATGLRRLLARELPSGVASHKHYASILGLSGRSLQRKLSAEGTTYNQVLNETRCDLAKSYLNSGRGHSLTEIAFLLGFSDASSFSRAFHRWTGATPSSYQQARTLGPAESAAIPQGL